MKEKLKTQAEIMSNWIGNKEQPMVSICCTTYNHGMYIEDAIIGFLIQETDFSFEVLIHDDASPDNTASIINRYHREYPEIIKPIIQSENQFNQGKKQPNLYFNFPRALGQYIAMCEGDDYWTDKDKLRKQIRFLEENKDFIGTAHNVRVIDESNKTLDDKNHIYGEFDTYVYSLKDAERYKLPAQTASLVYRNIWKELDKEIYDLFQSTKANGDQKISLILAIHGDIYCFSDVMAIHRKITTSGTSWSAMTFRKNNAYTKYTALIELNNFAQSSYGLVLKNKKNRYEAFYNSIIHFVKKPNIENWNIIKSIIDRRYDKTYELIFNVLYMLVSWPIRKAKSLFRNQ